MQIKIHHHYFINLIFHIILFFLLIYLLFTFHFIKLKILRFIGFMLKINLRG